MRDAFVRKLTQLAQVDDRIILVTGDLGFGVLTDFARKFPRQYLNAGVAEQNLTGLAAGMALDGKIVLTYSIANFPTLRCLEQIRNDAAYHEANVKIVSIGGGFSYGVLGMSHHATEDLAIMRSIPNVAVASPGCLWEVEEATEALVTRPGTCYLRLDKSDAGHTRRPAETFQFGKIRMIRPGSDGAIFATGGILKTAIEVSELLEREGRRIRVLSVHSLKPFDIETVTDVCRDVVAVLTLEEHVVDGGLGGLVAETCLEAGCPPRKFYRMGIRGGFNAVVGSQDYLRARSGLDVAAVADRMRRLLS